MRSVQSWSSTAITRLFHCLESSLLSLLMWYENLDHELPSSAAVSSLRKFGTIINPNIDTVTRAPPYNANKIKSKIATRSATATATTATNQKKKSSIASLIHENNTSQSHLVSFLKDVISQCESGSYPSSINGYILPIPTEFNTLDFILKIGFYLMNKSVIFPHDLVPEIKSAVSTLNSEKNLDQNQFSKIQKFPKSSKLKKTQKVIDESTSYHHSFTTTTTATSLLLPSSDSPPHIPNEVYENQRTIAPKWRSREINKECSKQDSKNNFQYSREKRRSSTIQENEDVNLSPQTDKNTDRVAINEDSFESLPETKDISTKFSAMHLSDEPVLKRSNSQPIQLNFHSPDGDVISSSPRHSPDPSNCSLLSSPPISGYDVIRSSGRLSCSSSSPDVNEISSPPCIKKHQQRLRLCNHPVTVTPLRHNRPELNPHSTPIGQINAIRLSGNFATPQDALKWCRKKFYRYPDREDEWNVSMKATDDVLRQFWKVFHASNLRNSPPNLLSAIPASSLAIVFSYLETFERPTVQLVCRHWCLSLHYLLAQEMCLLPTDSGLCNEGVPFVNSIDWQDHFTSYFTDISLVGDGTSKRVFSLLLDPSHRHDMTMTTTSPLISDFNTTMAALTTFTNPVVVSVMDLEDLFSREVSRQTIEAELQISLLCSSLYSLRICPCLLQTHFFFRSDQLLHENANFKTRHKRQKGKRRKSEILRNSREEGRYLYIGMEKCNGNLEEYLEAISSEQKEYSVTSIIAIFFQLCYALYVCREKMALVHYDLKLLNCLYLLADNTSSMTVEEMKSKKNGKYISKASHIAGSQSDIEMKIGFEDRMYSIPLSSSLHSTCGIVKLIDFGTSVMHNTNLGKPIQIQQFTTLENVPPEYLLCGDSNSQCYSADAFALGLCFLHLLMSCTASVEENIPSTGPYEEMMKDVRCPEGLKRRICATWTKRKKATHSIKKSLSKIHSYSVLKEVLASLEGNDGENIVCDTLYRYLILLYSPTGEKPAAHRSNLSCDHIFNFVEIEDSEIWRLIREMCWEETRGREAEACRHQFLQDSKQWNLSFGQHSIVKRVRHRLSHLPPIATDILYSLLSFNPIDRPPLYDVITSDLFDPLLFPKKAFPLTLDNTEGYLHYYRTKEDLAILPPLKRL